MLQNKIKFFLIFFLIFSFFLFLLPQIYYSYFLKQSICFFWNKEAFDFEKDQIDILGEPEYFSKKDRIEKIKINQNNFEIELKNKKIKIKRNNEIIWPAPNDWIVENFIYTDSTNQGEDYLNLLVWKTGSYGPYQPTWIKENDSNIKNHLFIFKINETEIKPIWQSSALSRPNCEMIFFDIDNDQQNELIVLEGSYEKQKCQAQYVAVWKWQEWGFQNKWRSEKGNYEKLRIEFFDEKNYIVVNKK